MVPLLLLLHRQDKYAAERAALVEELSKNGITGARVLTAMKSAQRHLFVPKDLRSWAYHNLPLPIGEGQTISQPEVVAFMTQELKLKNTDKVLEIGTGSGYQAAILTELVDSLFTIEIKSKLAANSANLFRELGYKKIQILIVKIHKTAECPIPSPAIRPVLAFCRIMNSRGICLAGADPAA